MSSKRVDLVWDRYSAASLKKSVRDMRGFLMAESKKFVRMRRCRYGVGRRQGEREKHEKGRIERDHNERKKVRRAEIWTPSNPTVNGEQEQDVETLAQSPEFFKKINLYHLTVMTIIYSNYVFYAEIAWTQPEFRCHGSYLYFTLSARIYPTPRTFVAFNRHLRGTSHFAPVMVNVGRMRCHRMVAEEEISNTMGHSAIDCCNTMTQIHKSSAEYWQWMKQLLPDTCNANVNVPDPRTVDWFLVRSPIPVVTIICSYIYFAQHLGPKLMQKHSPFDLSTIIMVYNVAQIIHNVWILSERSGSQGGHGTLTGLLNTFVHSIMYFYYLIAGLGPSFKKYLWWKQYLTLLQMVSLKKIFIYCTLCMACNNGIDSRTTDWFMVGSAVPVLIICMSYIYLVLYLGPKLMRNRSPFDLSTIIMVFNAIQIVHNVWMLNEIFFVLRKKTHQITLLHVFHHAGMPAVAFICVRYYPGGHSTFTVLLNTFIHSIMYLYYFVAALGPSFKKYLWWKQYLTVMQMTHALLIGSSSEIRYI
uniref:Elongation of very long chain fatty acids protein n=1 Tax=Timema cristinae TaxID=61476 RepID=A0A7R9CHW6_TIMCR|nr:unnamed protein product [Timema cristinae]